MKIKSLYSFVSAIMLSVALASCTNEMQELANDQSQALKQIVMTTQDFQPEADSRTVYQIADGAVTCTWAENDTVGVFPNEGAQAYFPMASGAGTKNATFDGKGWALKDGYTYGAYYPFIADILLDRNAVPVSYTGQTQVGNGSMAHLGDYDYMVATPTAPEFGSAQFIFKHLSALVQLKLTIPQPVTLTSVKLVAENKDFAQEGKVDIMADVPSITPATTAKEMELTLQDVSTTEENQVVTLYMMLPPTDLSNQTLKAVVVSDKGKQEHALPSKNFEAGKAYGLSGELNTAYRDVVVNLTEAGTMKKLLGKDYLSITSLKVVGPINGDDVYYLRKMLGGSDFSQADWGKLTTLDLSDARIVEGGEWYYKYSSSSKYYTANDKIGYRMFYQCTKLKEIVLPDGVTSIGNSAFEGCSDLTTITIGDNVTSIGDYDFIDCFALTSIDIPDNVTSMGVYAFEGCSALTTVTIGNGLTSIKASAFRDCSALTTITIGDNVTSIGDSAFEGCSALTSIDIPDNVASIDDSAFRGCSSLASIDIPNNVTSIGVYTFYRCSALTSITIGDGVTSIGDFAFEGCDALTSIDIPNNVTSIGNWTFCDCDALTTLTIGDGVTSIGDWTFYSCSALTTITIGNGVTSIGSKAFLYCDAVTTVTIGNGVTSIGSEAFLHCDALTDFYCHATTPPSIDTSYSEPFLNYGEKTTLHVPERCGSTYKSSKWGSYFKNIVEMD